ncbi:MAG TPA: uridine monophosphate kinase [Candidatus Nanoperiomorbaceae bacterium]|nr:uridine monophosphate kinase [Candidatus Nanoperiomorbaceae bacterium]HMQ96618.1 uridine monophosphate kinase [Candidatus Nanoperiomorbaceae bacterium]HMR86156.1 uridine monophosphate kinase [Candidatus Nanoperiomorbaceae bacterium]HMU11980.1 uridine monophosphate kinase [Candidatus Nanoperiomorbaceae bacterium]
MRLLLKLSGEQLAGDSPRGFSVERATWIADEIKKAKKESPDAEIVVIVGAGNFVRGAYFAGQHVRPVTADNMGMMGTMINAVALADVFNAEGLPTAALSNVSCQQIIDDYTHRRALSHLSKGRVVIVAGGTGRPYFTTDTSALNLAIELDCDVVAKATKVDGIFDDDPEKNPNARKLDTISYDDALRDKKVRVMDKAALALAAEHNKPVVVFELLKPGNIAKVASGQTVGTSIK